MFLDLKGFLSSTSMSSFLCLCVKLTLRGVLLQAVMRDDGCLRLEHFRVSPDNEGFMMICDKEEVDIYRRLEARVRLELGCVSQCVVIDLEGDRKGVILSLECEYDSQGGPSDQLSAPTREWFSSASWELSTATEVMANIREDGGIKHCIQVSTQLPIHTELLSSLHRLELIELTSPPPVLLSGLISGR